MAPVYERVGAGGKRVWQAKVRKKGAPQVTRTFDLKADAETWAREIEREHQRGNVAALRQDALRITIAEVLDRYEADRLPQLASQATLRGHLARVRERFGKLFIANVRGVDISRWRDDLLGHGLGNTTVAHHLTTLSGVFTYMAKDLGIDLPSGNPCRLVRKPKRSDARDRRLQPGEYEALQAERPELLAFIVLAIETSMRRGELAKLSWQFVDLDRCTAHLPKTKNGEARTVALSSLAVAILAGLPRRADGQVFPWKTADGFSSAWKRFRARVRSDHVLQRVQDELNAQGLDGAAEVRALVYHKRAPLPATLALYEQISRSDAFFADLRFHDLRHEAASRLFEKGLNIMEVASMTGHKSLSMLKRYTHVEAAKLARKLG